MSELRSAGLPIDITKYLLLLRAIEGGFGLDPEALKSVLRAICVHSEADARIFNRRFGRFLVEAGAATFAEETATLREAALELPREVQQTFTRLMTDGSEAVGTEQVLRHILHVASDSGEPEALAFTDVAVSPRDYMPVTRRQMRQNWRYLRLAARRGAPVEFDAHRTLSKILREGAFVDPILVPRRVNQAELVLLLDVHGSMSPFRDLEQRLSETAVDGGRFKRVRTYYFHNTVDPFVMTSPAFTDGLPLRHLLERTSASYTAVVIVSDAGAARGSQNDVRVEQTRVFLRSLARAGVRVVWLNPVPRERWSRSSAGLIERSVPMFEISRLGMDRAIAALKGKRVG